MGRPCPERSQSRNPLKGRTKSSRVLLLDFHDAFSSNLPLPRPPPKEETMKARLRSVTLGLIVSAAWACATDRSIAPIPVASVTLSQDTATLVPSATVTVIATARDV